jgi:predicted acyltransferase
MLMTRVSGSPMDARRSLDVPDRPAVTPASRPERLLALDAFRGMAIAGMILVNNPGTWSDVYWPLRHAAWNGWTPADLIFPFFLFIVGVAITLSLAQNVERGSDRRQLVVKMLRRTLTVFSLGIILNGFPRFDWSVLRIPGVLQRVAVCYCAASTAVLTLGIRGQSIAAMVLLIGYWAVMTLLAVPGHGGGGSSPENNLVAYVDNALLHGHLLFDEWDPEGLLSTLPAIATTLGGVLAGHWLRSARSQSEHAFGLFMGGASALGCGLVLGIWCPINKNLWSSSFAVFSAGVALSLFAVCYWLIDVKGYRRWALPFVVYGTNPIVAYVLSSLLAKVLLLWIVSAPDGSRVPFQQYVFETFFLRLARPINASLLYALAYVTLWLGITAFLYRRRIVIKI